MFRFDYLDSPYFFTVWSPIFVKSCDLKKV